MANEHLIKFQAISLYFCKNEKLLRRGENSYESGNVKEILFDSEINIIRGKVDASMKQRSYKVEVLLTDEFQIENGKCDCPRGQVICHHIAAVLLSARDKISKTDIACTWNPKPNLSSEALTFRQRFDIKKPPRLSKHDLNENDIRELKEKLEKIPPVGFKWILRNEVDHPDDRIHLPLMTDVINSIEFRKAENSGEFLAEKLKLSESTIIDVMNLTVGQECNPNWYIARKNRITASNFGKVIAAINRDKYPPSLFAALYCHKDLKRVKAIQWGRMHEKEGLKILSAMTKKEIKTCGVFLSSSGVLGASPDGIVDDDIIVEIKCPYKFRNVELTDALKNDNSYVIFYDNNGKLQINTNHPYYHQVQGQIYLSNRKSCYLCIWTPKQAIYCLIPKSNSWGCNLQKLQIFFFENYVSFLGSCQCNK